MTSTCFFPAGAKLSNFHWLTLAIINYYDVIIISSLLCVGVACT